MAGRCSRFPSSRQRPAGHADTPAAGQWSWSPWGGADAGSPRWPPPAATAAAWWQPGCRSPGAGRWGSHSARHGWSPARRRMGRLQKGQGLSLIVTMHIKCTLQSVLLILVACRSRGWGAGGAVYIQCVHKCTHTHTHTHTQGLAFSTNW